MCERSNVTSPARSRQTNHSSRSLHLSGVEIAEAIDFCCTQKTEMDASGLQQAQYSQHVEALGCAKNIWRIGHSVDQLGGRSRANDAILEDTDRIGGMSFLGHSERDQR